MKRISVIIVTHNSSKFIGKCIKSLVHFWPREYLREVIILDNDSLDSTISELKKYENKDLRVVKLDDNYGFAKAVNMGMKIAEHSDYYLLLNPDTVMDENSILHLVLSTEQQEAGVCGGRTYGFSNEIQGDHFRAPNFWIGVFDFTNLRKICFSDYWHNYFYYLDEKKSENSRKVDVVTGGFMLISKKTVNKIGYFDERFFMYLEDADYCLRARLNNIDVIYCPKASIRHYGGGSSHNRTRNNVNAWIESRRQYFLKNSNILENIALQPLFYVDAIIIRCMSLINSQ